MAASLNIGARLPAPAANATPLVVSPRSPSEPHRPVTAVEDPKDVTMAALVLKDGTSFQGVSFGAETKSISGECVFQTGNINYIVIAIKKMIDSGLSNKKNEG